MRGAALLLAVVPAACGGGDVDLTGVFGEDHVALPPGGCTPAEAEARDDAMPCVAHARMTATRL